MMTRRTTTLLALIFALALPVWAQESGLAFLRVGTNVAAIAMGDAYVAHSRDAFATYWNPSGLAAASSNLAALSHHVWIADVRTYALATRFQAGSKGGLGLFITATGSSDFEAREGPGVPDGFFDAQFLSAGMAYGRALGPIRIGVTAKYLSERIFTNDADGYAFDFGMQLDVLDGGVRLGAALQNLGKMGALNAEATALPRTLRVGGALFPFRILSQDDAAPLLHTFVTAEVSHNFANESTQFHVGAAAEVFETIILRAGYLSNDTLRDISIGGGLRSGGFLFDYALLPFESGFGGPGHVFTLGYEW